MMKIARIGLSLLLVLAFAMPAFAGWQSRTLEIEAYETIDMTVDVPFVLTDPATFDEKACSIITKADWYCAKYEQIPDIGTFTLDITNTRHGSSHVFDAPDGTISVVGEYKYWDWCTWSYKWKSASLTRNGSSNNWKFGGGNKDGYRNVIATYQDITGYHDGQCIQDAFVYSPQVVCPADAVITHTETINYSFDRVVTEIMLGDSIKVRGHIWTKSPRPVTYWYVAQLATIPANAKTVAKSDKIVVPDVHGVCATDSFTFTPTKAGLYRIFLRVLKVDGTIGEIRTKVIVSEAADIK